MTRFDPGEHFHFMRKALAQARRALEHDEVPVGAVVVLEGKIIGRGYNRPIAKADPTAHAEIQALRQAARWVGNYRLTRAALYCTLEPCAMCAGALIQARVSLLIFGARDSKAGAISSRIHLLEASFLNHHVQVIGGILEEESSQLLRQFFRLKRSKSRAAP
jgi:tRNA(adenine34) deaminase